jgi:putative ABC transport system ATP-binding protein
LEGHDGAGAQHSLTDPVYSRQMTDLPHIRTTDLRRYYRRGKSEVRALDGVSVTVGRGEFVSLVGASGSGKTSLLNLMAGLDTPTSGTVEFDGVSLASMARRDRARQRAKKIGMIFQSFNLIAHYTALQNVETALYFDGTPRADRTRLATAALEQLGLSDRLTHRPADLSGGEQQRVAVARAVVKQPEILFADEPTGNLDYDNSRLIMSLMKQYNVEGLTIVLVTHNLDLARGLSHRIVKMEYGTVVESMPGEAHR